MARTVHCRRYGEDLEGLERPPCPAPKARIFLTTSQRRRGSSGRATRPCSSMKAPEPDGSGSTQVSDG
ncbi:MAG: hypothetical protein CM15mP103_00310 [Gammaproteobacteria bacterium]|nr:MAG: hypothetical protein CM15mP103_00310 [Gammaproteobacteria bacterium]